MIQKKYFVIIPLLIFAFLTYMSFGFKNLSATEVGVVVNKIANKVIDIPVAVGYCFYNKWKTDIIVYDMATRSFPEDVRTSEAAESYTFDLKTNDGQKIYVDVSIIYSLIKEFVPELHKTTGPKYEDQILYTQLAAETKTVIGSYNAEQMYQGKSKDLAQSELQNRFITKLSPFRAIKVHQVLIRGFKFDASYEDKIAEKQLASQQVEINKNMALAEEENAKAKEAQARGEKLRVLQEAQGKAESAEIAAKGAAAAVRVNAEAEKFRLEQEAEGLLAKYTAEAEGKRLLTEAVGGGANLVNLTFAQNIPDKLQIWGIPTGGAGAVNIHDLSGLFGNIYKKENSTK